MVGLGNTLETFSVFWGQPDLEKFGLGHSHRASVSGRLTSSYRNELRRALACPPSHNTSHCETLIHWPQDEHVWPP